MRRRASCGSIVAIVALAGACSSSITDEGFISIGRDNGEDGGVSGTGGSVPGMGGVFSIGGDYTGGVFPTGGISGVGGTAGTVTVGGTAGDATGGTSAGGEPSCGSGGMPKVTDSFATGEQILDACGRAGPNGRICLADDSAMYCGASHHAILEYCRPGTCENGCCHATSDPCPIFGLDAYFCTDDCVGFRDCTAAPIVNLTLGENDFRVVRVGGSNTMDVSCGTGTRHYFELFLSGPLARVTVSPPWFLAKGFTCADGTNWCLLSDGEASVDRVVIVMTDADPPPPRNVVIETSDDTLTCP